MIGRGYKKTISTLKAITAVAASAQSISSILTARKAIQALVFIDFGLDSVAAPVGAEFIVQASQQDSGNATWRTLDGARRITGTVTPTAIVLGSGGDATPAAGATVIACTAAVPVRGDSIFFKNSTIANSEWSRVVGVDATGGAENFTIRDGLSNAQAAGTYYNKAEHFVIPVDLRGITRLRVVCNNNYAASAVSCVWRCTIITTDLVDVAGLDDLPTVA